MADFITSRRSFLVGLGALIAAPAIVRASVIMPVKPVLIVPEPQIITDLTFPIEGYARQSGWQSEWRSCDFNDSNWMHKPIPKGIRHIGDGTLANFKQGQWQFTNHPSNDPTTVMLRDGSSWQRMKHRQTSPEYWDRVARRAELIEEWHKSEDYWNPDR